MIQDADVVVVGGGVHGASAAYHLAKAGKQVALVEKWTVGSGSSGTSGESFRCTTRTSQWSALPIALHNDGQNSKPNSANQSTTCGMVCWSQLRPQTQTTCGRLSGCSHGSGSRPHTVDVGGIHRWVPEFNLSGLALATYEAEAGYADPYSAAVAFASKARELGAQIYTKPTVRGIEGNGTGCSPGAHGSWIDSHTADPVVFEAEIYDNLMQRCPWAEKMSRVRSWSGPDGNSPDFHLIFGPVPGYLQVVGGSGNSFKLSPATGEVIAEFVTTGRCSYVDLDAFSIVRLAEGRPFRGGDQMHIIG